MNIPELKIGENTISLETAPFVIAEIGVNHEGDLSRAKRQIISAKRAGADAVKFQIYKADKLASVHANSYWDTNYEPALNQKELFSRYDKLGPKEYEELQKYCLDNEISFMATPFDLDSVDLIENWVDCYKIASADITALPLIRHVASKNKPIILSTGASTLEEIRLVIAEIGEVTEAPVALLHCVLNYPTSLSNANLGGIDSLRRTFPDNVIGLSDHTIPGASNQIIEYAYAAGARVIETHFTDDKTSPGNDHYHALDEADLGRLVDKLSSIRETFGSFTKNVADSEQSARANARRSIVVARDVKRGEVFSCDNLTFKRPGTGLSPLLWDSVIGKCASKDLDSDHLLSYEDFEG